MNNKETAKKGIFNFVWGVICAVLICLKLNHAINWSWGLILLPLYLPLGFVCLTAIFAVAILVAEAVREDK